MTKFNPLLAIPSPRNIPKTTQAYHSLDVDKLWVKYYPENIAYAHIQRFFLEHREYTHLVISADDLLVQPEQFEALKSSVRANQEEYPVFSGVCNNDMVGGCEFVMAVSLKFPPCNPRRHTYGYGYAFVDARGHNMDRRNPDKRGPAPTGIHHVSFAGFPCMFIRRDILQRLTLRTDYEYNLQYRMPGSSVDTVFCWDCYHAKPQIPIHADFDVKMLHLRGWQDPCMQLLVNVEGVTPYVALTKANEVKPIIVPMPKT